MKNTVLRFLSIIISFILIISVLASCANNENDKQTIASVTDTVTNEVGEDVPVFAEEDYGGREFVILTYDDNATDFIDHYIDSEEHTGEPMNDAVFDRNQMVEEKYNVQIVQRKCSAGPGITASRAAKSGTVDFDLIYEWGIRLVPYATEGMFYDFNQLDYPDLSRSYWAPSAQDDLTIADKMLISTCDISMNRIGWAYFLFFNRSIVEDLNMTLPYDYVDQNNWNLDTFLGMVIGSEQDDGDTIWTNNDQYGYLGDSSDAITWFASCAGILGTVKNEDGSYTLDVLNDKLISIYNNYNDKMATSEAFSTLTIGQWLDGHDATLKFESPYKNMRFASFGEGHVLFAKFSMDMTSELIDMEDDYGVVPAPKYDSTQQDYFHVIDSCAPMFSIPKQAADLDMVGVIMEYMAYESEQRLLPAFYEQTIKTKRMTDMEGRDEAMLDLIRDSVHYSWTSLYYLAMEDNQGEPWDPCGSMLSGMLSSGNFSSIAKMYSSAAQYQIDKLYDTILDLDVNK